MINASHNAPVAGASAWESWSKYTKYRHPNDRNYPQNVWVPLWFDGYWDGHRYGHVLWAKGGKYYSSPAYAAKTSVDVYSSLAVVERVYGMKYVGWSEDIGGMRVVRKEESMTEAERVIYNKGVVLAGIKKLGEGNILFRLKRNTDQWKLDTVVGGSAKSAAKVKKGDMLICQSYVDLTYKGKKARYYLRGIDLEAGRIDGVNRVDVEIVKTWKDGQL